MWSSQILHGKTQSQRLAYILVYYAANSVDEDFLMKKIERLSSENLEKLLTVLAYESVDYASDDAGAKLLKMKDNSFERWLHVASVHVDEAFIAASKTENSHLDLIDALFWYLKKSELSEFTNHQERCLIWATAAAWKAHSSWRFDDVKRKKVVLGQNADGSLSTNKYLEVVTSPEFLTFVLNYEQDPKTLYKAIKKSGESDFDELGPNLTALISDEQTSDAVSETSR